MHNTLVHFICYMTDNQYSNHYVHDIMAPPLSPTIYIHCKDLNCLVVISVAKRHYNMKAIGMSSVMLMWDTVTQ